MDSFKGLGLEKLLHSKPDSLPFLEPNNCVIWSSISTLSLDSSSSGNMFLKTMTCLKKAVGDLAWTLFY
jgi:hypothetical protein